MSNIPYLSIFHSPKTTVVEEHLWAFRNLQLPELHVSLQCPELILVVGRSAKSRFLRGVFLENGETIPAEPHGAVRLWSHPGARSTRSPAVFVDGELHHAMRSQRSPAADTSGPRRETAVEISHDKAGAAPQALQRYIVFRFYLSSIAPFLTSMCIFTADFGGLRSALQMLAQQMADNQGSADPSGVPTRLIFVTGGSHDLDLTSADVERLLSAHFSRITKASSLEDGLQQIRRSFCSITVFHAYGTLQPHTELWEYISTQSILAKEARKARCLDFSRRHLEVLLAKAVQYCCTVTQKPFIVMEHAFGHLGDSSKISSHIEEALNRLPQAASIYREGVDLVASAMMFSSLPPGMHFFQPKEVFETRFAAPCRTAIQALTIHVEIQESFVTGVCNRFIHLAKLVQGSGDRVLAVGLHRDEIARHRSVTASFRSHRSCLCCLHRMPEKVLTCGHALCDTCIRAFGTRSSTQRHTYTLEHCNLCGAANDPSVYHFQPPTAGARILSLDGGGVKGIIPLVFLQRLQAELGFLQVPIRDFFDLVHGTSSGGLIVLGIFIMRWSLDHCIDQFISLSNQVFRRRTYGALLFQRLQDYIVSYLADCRYDTEGIEFAFRTAFGTNLAMFNPITNDTKVAVTTTTAGESLPCLFTNYNGGERPKDSGHRIMRARSPEHDIRIDEAARCTSAAPGYFATKTLQYLGTFQDGGLSLNNPLAVALYEAKFLWPKQGEPDFALSVGTGTAQVSSPLLKHFPQSPVRDRFVKRIFKTFMRSLDGEVIWNEVVRSQSTTSRTRLHRLNIIFSGKEPGLDDLNVIPALQEETERQCSGDMLLRPVIDSIWASMFYFELESVPVFSRGYYHCVGHISCRLDLNNEARAAMYERLAASSAFFLVDGHPIPCVDRKFLLKAKPPFRKQVKFGIKHLHETLGITIRGVTLKPQLISGMPKMVDELIQLQELDSPFGQVSHEPDEKALPHPPAKRKREVTISVG